MTSDPETISDICGLIHQGRSDIVKASIKDIPQSILDVGCGWGAYGVLFRCYMDVGHGRPDYEWNRTLDGIEPFEKFHNPLHDYVYNHIWWETAETALDKIDRKYDIVFANEVLEHMEKGIAQIVINKCLEKTNKFFIAGIPTHFFNTGHVGGNPYNVHKSYITEDMFPKDCHVKTYPYGHKIIICDLRK